MRIHHGLVVLCSSLLLACGGDGDGPGTGPVSPADAAAGCRLDCQHDADCGGTTETVDMCTTDCVAETDWVRADAFDAIIECMSSLACGVSDDQCIAECVPTSAHEAFEAQCRATLAGCGTPDDINSFCETTPAASTDIGFLCLATPAIMDELTACLAPGTACQAAGDCVQAALAAHGIDF